MNRISRLGLVCLLLAALSAPAQEPPRIPFGQDIHAFRFLLKQQDLEALTSIDDLAVEPENTTLIVLGDMSLFDEPPAARLFRDFVVRGGAVLIASDRDSVRTVEEVLGIHTDDVKVSTGDETDKYKGVYSMCPVIPTAGERKCVADHPIFKGLAGKGIATNRPGFLRYVEGTSKLQRPFLAWFPESCLPDPLRMEREKLKIDRLNFAAECGLYKGRILVLADHSVFINSMMMQEDNDNLQFAYNCIDWLTSHGERKRVLVLDEGKPVGSLDVKVTELPQMPPHPVDMVNTLLRGMQDHDPGEPSPLNRTLADLYGPERIKATAAILVTMVLVAYGFLRLAQARQQP